MHQLCFLKEKPHIKSITREKRINNTLFRRFIKLSTEHIYFQRLLNKALETKYSPTTIEFLHSNE